MTAKQRRALGKTDKRKVKNQKPLKPYRGNAWQAKKNIKSVGYKP
jgi:hypothetical protein